MDTSEPQELENLADPELVERLRCTDWNDPLFISEERLLQLFQSARAAGNAARVGHCSNELSRRLLSRSRGFAKKNALVPQHYPTLDEAALALADYIWERLLVPKNAEFASRRFGKFFDYKAISFFRELIAKRRAKIESLEDWQQDCYTGDEDGEDEYDIGDRSDATLEDQATPEKLLDRSLNFAQVHARLQLLFTAREYAIFVMLWRKQMKVKDIAAALRLSPRMINNHTRRIQEKISKEFNV